MDLNSERGASLILVSVLIVIILIASSALMMTTQQSVTISRLAVHRNQSLMNARDGVQLAEQHAQQLWPADTQSFVSSMNTYLSNLNQNGAPFTASVSQNPNATPTGSTFTLKVTGHDKPYQKTLQVTMNTTKAQIENSVFQYVAYSKKSLYEFGNPSITGKTLVQRSIIQWDSPPPLFGLWPDVYNWESNYHAENDFHGKLTQYLSNLLHIHSFHNILGGEHSWGYGHEPFGGPFGFLQGAFSGSFFGSAPSTNSRHFKDLLPSPFQSTVMQKNETVIEQSAKHAASKDYQTGIIDESNPLPTTGGYIYNNDFPAGWGPATFYLKSNQTVNGPLYVNGSLIIAPGAALTVNGSLYINGNLVVNGVLQSSSQSRAQIQKVFVSGFSLISPSQTLNTPLVLVSEGDIVVMPAPKLVYGKKPVNNTGTTLHAFFVSGGDIFVSNGFASKDGFDNFGQVNAASLTLDGGLAAEGNIYLIDNSSIFPFGNSDGDASEGDGHHQGDTGNGGGDSGSQTTGSAALSLVYDPTFLQNVVIPGLPTLSGLSQSASSIHFTSPTTGTP
ncbi:hypothetical protein [Alicyclobacillus sp. SO9]|uniref:hypothetical protein n=1 Tax=Alicyclobacillus sp. SO9 TaxID=2665646 RepID=UPI0018E84552|nr:hypothetical protein [Alicyclobacillus sp. SO9]QQE77551.1 hypothetical protein GI364_16610 [Alicyclobacillus sp. SO9]